MEEQNNSMIYLARKTGSVIGTCDLDRIFFNRKMFLVEVCVPLIDQKIKLINLKIKICDLWNYLIIF